MRPILHGGLCCVGTEAALGLPATPSIDSLPACTDARGVPGRGLRHRRHRSCRRGWVHRPAHPFRGSSAGRRLRAEQGAAGRDAGRGRGVPSRSFDTGFDTFEMGWTRIREDDRGLLWEHLVLDSLRFRHLDENIFYWRDKAGREIDFVVRRQEGVMDTFECRIDPDEVDVRAVRAFRSRYPRGRDYVVVPVVKRPYRIRRGGREFVVRGTGGLLRDGAVESAR